MNTCAYCGRYFDPHEKGSTAEVIETSSRRYQLCSKNCVNDWRWSDVVPIPEDSEL